MVYKYIHIVGTSPESIAEAMKDAVDELGNQSRI